MQQTDLSTARARSLRSQMSPAERALWQELRGRRFLGLKVRRQVPVGPYLATFYCADFRLIIDLPGAAADDPVRVTWLSERGFQVQRLTPATLYTALPARLLRLGARDLMPPSGLRPTD